MKDNVFLYFKKKGMYFLILGISCIALLIHTSCEKEVEYGIPSITNIRTTDPALAEEALDTAGLGQLIVIQGQNLGSTQRIFFNSVEAFVNPVYVTENNVIVRVPSEFPEVVNDSIRLISLGGEAMFYLPIAIPTPEITRFPLEWVPEGGILTIIGEFFYNINSIGFTGGVSTENFVVVSPEKIEVVVPAEVLSGPITVFAAAGVATSDVWFRDNRGMLINFDSDFPICWGGPENVVDVSAMPPGHPVQPISGNFFYINQSYAGGTWWIQESIMAYCGAVSVTGAKTDFALAFEFWVGDAWNSNWWEIEMRGTNTVFFEWRGYNTPALGGAERTMENTGWITVKIPLSDITALEGNTFSMGRFGSYKAQHADDIEFAFDNIRLVPIN